MKVLLISTNNLIEPYAVYPLGLDYVAGALHTRHQVEMADVNALQRPAALGDIIRDFSPDIIGISLRNIDTADTTDPKAFIKECRELTRMIRNWSNAILVCGGSGFTLFPEKILDAMQADYGIIGEGERFALLIDALERGEDAADIPGVITSLCRKGIPDPWDAEPRRQFHNEYPHLQFYLKKGGMLNLQTKRGCNFNCIYCSYPLIEGRNLRCMHPENVAKTALKLQEAGAKYLCIVDSLFNADIPHSLAVAQAFKKAGVSVQWGAFLAPVKLPDNYFRIMADAGMTHVEFGTESLSDVMLASYRKPFLTDHVFKAHKDAKNAGLHVAHYFLLGGPEESPETLKETFSNASKLEKSVSFFFCGIRIYPNTELYNIALNEGNIPKSLDLLEPVFYRPKQIEINEIIRLVEAQVGEHPNWLVGSGGQEAAKVVARMHERGYSGPRWEILAR